MKVCKIFEISYAHRLLNHPGKCRRVHGHNGKIEVTVEGPFNSDTGMVIDFDIITSTIGRLIEDTLDHKIILEVKDPLIEHLHIEEVVLLESPPTAEVLARMVYRWTIDSLYVPCKEVEKVEVKFWETPSSYAVVDSLVGSAQEDGKS